MAPIFLITLLYIHSLSIISSFILHYSSFIYLYIPVISLGSILNLLFTYLSLFLSFYHYIIVSSLSYLFLLIIVAFIIALSYLLMSYVSSYSYNITNKYCYITDSFLFGHLILHFLTLLKFCKYHR